MRRHQMLVFAIFFGVVFVGLLAAAEKKFKPVFYCTSNGKVGVEFCEDVKAVEAIKRQLDREYDESVEVWKANGEKGPKPLKPYVVNLKDIRETEKDGEKFKQLVEKTEQKAEKKITEIKENAIARMDALLGIDPENTKKDVLPWKEPPTLAERGIPEKYIPMLTLPNVQAFKAMPWRLCFWAKVDPKPGWDAAKPVRMVIHFDTNFTQLKGVIDDKYQEYVKKYGPFKFYSDVNNGKAEAYRFHDYYRVDMKPDGVWREYRIPIAWEICRPVDVRIHKKNLVLEFCAADPAVFFLDDVSMQWDSRRMTFEERDKIMFSLLRNIRVGRKAGEEENDGKKNKPKKKKDDDEDIFDDTEVGKVMILGLVPNGDFNQVFDDFVANWKRGGAEDEAGDEAGAEAAGATEKNTVRVTRENGNRPEPEVKGKTPAAPDQKDREKNPDEFKLVGAYHVKCDATAFDPESFNPEKRRKKQ